VQPSCRLLAAHLAEGTVEYSRNPEVVTTCSPDFVAVADHVGDKSWAKVTSEVDSISCLPPEASTNSEDDEEEAERREWTSADVSFVFKCVDHEHEEGTGNEFREELTGLSHERGGIGAEDAGGGGLAVAWDCSDVGTTLEDVDG